VLIIQKKAVVRPAVLIVVCYTRGQ